MQDVAIRCPKCGEKVTSMQMEGALYRCPGCRTQFGPNESHHPFASVMTKVEVEVHSLHGESFSIRFSSSRGNRQVRVTEGGKVSWSEKLSDEEWLQFGDALFKDAYLDKWKSSYFNPSIMDGTTWTITVNFEKKHTLSLHGCNGYAPYWDTLMEILSPYLVKGKVTPPKATL